MTYLGDILSHSTRASAGVELQIGCAGLAHCRTGALTLSRSSFNLDPVPPMTPCETLPKNQRDGGLTPRRSADESGTAPGCLGEASTGGARSRLTPTRPGSLPPFKSAHTGWRGSGIGGPRRSDPDRSRWADTRRGGRGRFKSCAAEPCAGDDGQQEASTWRRPCRAGDCRLRVCNVPAALLPPAPASRQPALAVSLGLSRSAAGALSQQRRSLDFRADAAAIAAGCGRGGGPALAAAPGSGDDGSCAR